MVVAGTYTECFLAGWSSDGADDVAFLFQVESSEKEEVRTTQGEEELKFQVDGWRA